MEEDELIDCAAKNYMRKRRVEKIVSPVYKLTITPKTPDNSNNSIMQTIQAILRCISRFCKHTL